MVSGSKRFLIYGGRASLALLLILTCKQAKGQTEEFNYFYRVVFTDKGTYTPASFSPGDLLSEKAILRRQKSSIPFPDYRDLPVFQDYIEAVKSCGFTHHSTSKWMNSALFQTKDEADTEQLTLLPFVAEVKLVKKPVGKSTFSDKLDLAGTDDDTDAFDWPVRMLNGHSLQNAEYDGTGILIAVLDGGFLYADRASSLYTLRMRNGIKYTYDFVNKNPIVYGYHTHGTAVLSVLAGSLDGIMRGSAPDADFLLLRTEDGASEFPAEEDFWVAGAEFADSAGADIISSSLGYSTFDDPSMNYTFSDLDGNTAFITRAADIAASKGMVVVNSAGNERNKTWIRIIAPSDGDSVLAAGAVNADRVISSFSSAGPSADGQVKPDISAMGVNLLVQSSEMSLSRSSGTSFSCPVISGMAACLMEAIPEADNMDIIRAIRSSSDRFSLPDSLYGFGIPDMTKALITLESTHLDIPAGGVSFGPNPTAGDIEFTFSDPPGHIIAEIVSASGIKIYRKDYGDFAGRQLSLTALRNMEQGLYFVRFITSEGSFVFKIVKLRERP
ncbi:MAG: S8 family serine peptidase [Bacteroidales bacterium]|nr:S8 family serine peptidase [Bacteroidales bacterium]MBN2632941.1 S8 family serine peptidase [Bacteroidales bacterium]